jgi:glycosyltransferase involved in cell wall biosynthesis
VSTPDLLKFTPNGKWLPSPLDLKSIRRFKKLNYNYSKKVRIAHYPYYRDKPEWSFVGDLIKDLKKQSEVDIVEVYGMNNEKCLETISDCEIIIGKILPKIGWFGKFELEAMALGKPVIAHVSDELYDIYKPPIYRTTNDTFLKDIESLINDKSLQKKLANDGARYVEKHHDSQIIIDKALEYYDKLKCK